jgi:uncharacterized protein YwgA
MSINTPIKSIEKKPDQKTLVVILYIIERLNGVLGKTHLQKILFLADLLSVKKFKEPITSLKFEKNHFGPFSYEVNSYVKHLQKKGFINIKELPFINDEQKNYIRYYYTYKSSTKKLLSQRVDAEKIVLLDDVINSFGNVSLQEILDVVYKLETVKNSDLHKPLEMAKIIQDDDSEVEEMDIF